MRHLITGWPTRDQQLTIAARVAMVVLALATALIHLGLGSLLFLANAAGFAVLAVALVVPGRMPARVRPLSIVALIGFSAATVGGWVLFGARYFDGYLATGIEILIIAIGTLDLYRQFGGPRAAARRARTAIGALRGAPADA